MVCAGNLDNLSLDQPWIAIAPMRLELVQQYHTCLDSVCREGHYLMSSCAPDIEKSRQFVSDILSDNLPMFVALVPGPTVIGWVDISRKPYEAQQHVGVLGIGIHARFRGEGLGSLLMERALKKSITAGLERIELDVFSSNRRAISVYGKFGFQVEGTKRFARKTKSGYEDIIIMARILREPKTSTAITGTQI